MSEYSVDGVDLDDPKGRWFVTKETLLPSVASLRNVNVTVPGRSGVLPIMPGSVDPFEVTVSICVVPDGNPGGRAGLDRNYNALLNRVRRLGGGLLVLGHNVPGRPRRRAMARLKSVAEPQFHYFDNIIDTTLIFECVDGVWQDEEATETRVYSGQPIAGLKGGSMPIFDPVFLCRATSNAITIRDGVSGSSLTLDSDIQAGKWYAIYPRDYAAYLMPDGDHWAPESGVDHSAWLTQSSGGFMLLPSNADDEDEQAVTVFIEGAEVWIRARRAF